MWLSDALPSKGTTNRTQNQSKPYGTHDHSKLYLERIDCTRSVVGQRYVSFPSRWGTPLRKNSLSIDTFPTWEVFNGVGVDGVTGVSLFFRFSSSFFVFLHFSSPFFAFLRFAPHSSRTRANNCKLLEKWGILLRPVCTYPVQNFPTNFKLGEGEVGVYKVQAYPGCERDRKEQVPKFSLPRESLQNKGF